MRLRVNHYAGWIDGLFDWKSLFVDLTALNILRNISQDFLAFVLLRTHNRSQVESAETSVRWAIVPLGLPNS